MDADGSNQTRITFEEGVDRDPAWSLDGNRLAYFSYPTGGDSGIWLLDVTTGEKYREINAPDGQYPTWSPDGHWIYYSKAIPDGEDELWRVQSIGAGTPEPVASGGHHWEPDVSNDGAQVAVTTDGGASGYDVLTLPASGGAATTVVGSAGQQLGASWSPDDSQLAYMDDTGGDFEIAVVDSIGGTPTYLTNNSVADDTPDWRPPGTCLDDSREDNDTPLTATDLGSGGEISDGVICPGDEDWFTISAQAGETITVTLTQDRHAGDVVLTLYDSDGVTPLATTLGGTADSESVSATELPAGTHYLRVVGGDGTTNSFALTATTACTVCRYEESTAGFVYDGGWQLWSQGAQSGGAAMITNVEGARADISFTGASVRWIGQRGPDRAIARVFVDGVDMGLVDTYASSWASQQVLFTASGLSAGEHVLSIVREGKNAATTGSGYLVMDAVEAAGVW